MSQFAQIVGNEPPHSVEPNLRSFRIMCRRADGAIALCRVLPTLGEAVRIAKLAADKHLNKLRRERAAVLRDPSRPRAVYLERWVGSSTAGHC